MGRFLYNSVQVLNAQDDGIRKLPLYLAAAVTNLTRLPNAFRWISFCMATRCRRAIAPSSVRRRTGIIFCDDESLQVILCMWKLLITAQKFIVIEFDVPEDRQPVLPSLHLRSHGLREWAAAGRIRTAARIGHAYLSATLGSARA